DLEAPHQKFTPGAVARAMGGGLVLGCTGRAVVVGVAGFSGRWGWRDDTSSPLARSRKYAGVPDSMKMWGRHRGREAHQKRQRIEIEGEGAVAEGALELEAHQVAGDQLNVFSSDRGAKDVFAECFTTDGVVGCGSGGGVQREAVGGGAEPCWIFEVAARTEVDGVSLAQGRTGGDATQGGRHGELGERRLGIRERLVGVDCVVLNDALATEQAQDARLGVLQDVSDV